MSDIIDGLKVGFTARYNATPVIYFSPGRINLIGEHVDYNDGFVMPAAIDKGVYFAIAPNNTNTANFYAIDFDDALEVPLDNIQKNESWKNYVLGVLNEFVKAGLPVKGFDCVFGGDIPRGSGMSSSAAVEGGLAMAVNDLFNAGLDRVALALLCQRAEHNFPGVQCGIMDQYANMMSRTDEVILLDCMNLTSEYLPLHIDGYKIVLLDSGVHHSLASGEYNIRRAQCAEGLAMISQELGIKSFRDLRPADMLPWKQKMDEVIYNRCLYVVEEIQRTQEAATALKQGNVDRLGELMFATHNGLSNLYEVSCRELDLLVNLAGSNPAVAGARMMGGGFGGCTINIIKEDELKTFIETATKEYSTAFNIQLKHYVVQTGAGTRKMED